MNRALIKVAVVLALMAASFWAGREWRDRSADLAESRRDTSDAQAGQMAEQAARGTEQKQAQAAQAAGDQADNREAQIDADYERRLQAALVGRDADHERMRQHWAASCATDRLSSGAAAAAEAAEQDRLRRASAARVLRAVELAQSERDECVDRYGAIAGTVVTQ